MIGLNSFSPDINIKLEVNLGLYLPIFKERANVGLAFAKSFDTYVHMFVKKFLINYKPVLF